MNLIKLVAFLGFLFQFYGSISSKDFLEDEVYLQNFINYSDSNSVIVIPKRTYYISSTLFIPSNRIIDFNYSTIVRKNFVFDLIQNSDTVNGNKNIKIFNLFIDGHNDTLDPVNPKHRFSGIYFSNVLDVKFKNVSVEGTVNNESGAGIYLLESKNVLMEDIFGYHNDRTAVILRKCNNIVIDTSQTAFNRGGGIAITDSRNCKVKNVLTHDNGYSNLSINGVGTVVENVISFNSNYSGVNIGHNNELSRADSSSFFNILSYSNRLEGITLANSDFITLDSVVLYENRRNNLRISSNSDSSTISRVSSFDSVDGQGVLIEGGHGHRIMNSSIFNNAGSGIYILEGIQTHVFKSVVCYGNNVNNMNGAEITVINALNCIIETPATLKSSLRNYVWLSGGRENIIYSVDNNAKIRLSNKALYKVIKTLDIDVP